MRVRYVLLERCVFNDLAPPPTLAPPTLLITHPRFLLVRVRFSQLTKVLFYFRARMHTRNKRECIFMPDGHLPKLFELETRGRRWALGFGGRIDATPVERADGVFVTTLPFRSHADDMARRVRAAGYDVALFECTPKPGLGAGRHALAALVNGQAWGTRTKILEGKGNPNPRTVVGYDDTPPDEDY